MNRIVREHYPVEKLPEDLRPTSGQTAHVTVTITLESDDDLPAPLTSIEAAALMRQMQKENFERGRSVNSEEAVRRIRELRDEWDN